MILLEWVWTFRFGTYAKARLASQPVLVVLPLLAGALVAFLERGDGIVACVVLFAVTVVLAAVVMLTVMWRQVRRQLAVARTHVQEYALTAAVLDVGLGRDRHSLPLSELFVAGAGTGWLTLRRRGMGGRPLILFFDDLSVVPVAEGIIEEHGASRHT